VVDVERPGAFTAAMIRLFEDPALAAEMSARAVENARRHSWERLLERLFQSDPPAAPAAHTKAAGLPAAGGEALAGTTISPWPHPRS
jgi:hypothetical protein